MQEMALHFLLHRSSCLHKASFPRSPEPVSQQPRTAVHAPQPAWAEPGDGSRAPTQRHRAWGGAGFPTPPKNSVSEKSVPLVHALCGS